MGGAASRYRTGRVAPDESFRDDGVLGSTLYGPDLKERAKKMIVTTWEDTLSPVRRPSVIVQHRAVDDAEKPMFIESLIQGSSWAASPDSMRASSRLALSPMRTPQQRSTSVWSSTPSHGVLRGSSRLASWDDTAIRRMSDS